MYPRKSRLRTPAHGTTRSLLISAVAALGLASCADSVAVGPSLALKSATESNLRSYRFGVGDKVRLTVFGEPDLSGTFEINPAGNVSLPLAGEVRAAGLDTDGLREAARRRYADGYLKNPRITVEVASYRPIYVHGEVRSAGEFPYKTGLRLSDAIALAGGYSYRANTSYVVLSRKGQPREANVGTASDMPIVPGDNIRVPERYF